MAIALPRSPLLSMIPVVDEIEALAAEHGMRVQKGFYKIDQVLSAETVKVFALQLDNSVGPLFVIKMQVQDAAEAEVSTATANVQSGSRLLTPNGRVPLNGIAVQDVGPVVVLSGERISFDVLFPGSVSAQRSVVVEGFHFVNEDGSAPAEQGPADVAARLQMHARGEWTAIRQEHTVGSKVEQEFPPLQPFFLEGFTITAGTDGTFERIKVGSRDLSPAGLTTTTMPATRVRTWARPPEQLRSRRAAGMVTGAPKVNFYGRIFWG